MRLRCPLLGIPPGGQTQFALVAVRRLATWNRCAYLRTFRLYSCGGLHPVNLGATRDGGHAAGCCFLRRAALGAAFTIGTCWS